MEAKIRELWRRIAAQEAEKMRTFFAEEAVIYWHNTNEKFTLAEYIRANCEYPGDWQGHIERVTVWEEKAVSVTRVWNSEGLSFHAVSFYDFTGGKIIRMEEYWGDDGETPAWRREKKLGVPIRK